MPDIKLLDGKKIPFLYTINNNKKGLIIKLSKLLATKKKVAYYITTTYNGEKYEIICEFESNGDIRTNRWTPASAFNKP